jgi:hypothetical protein
MQWNMAGICRHVDGDFFANCRAIERGFILGSGLKFQLWFLLRRATVHMRFEEPEQFGPPPGSPLVGRRDLVAVLRDERIGKRVRGDLTFVVVWLEVLRHYKRRCGAAKQ